MSWEMELEIMVKVVVDNDGTVDSAVIDQDDLKEKVQEELVDIHDCAAEADADSRADR